MNRTTEYENIGKRFKVIGFIILAIAGIGIYLLLTANKNLSLLLLYSGLLISSWYVADYKMLRVPRYYMYSLFIAFGFFIYFFTVDYYTKFSGRLFDPLSVEPLVVLLVQKPLRFLHKAVFKKEPVVQKPFPSFRDAVYFILLVGLGLGSIVWLELLIKLF